MKKIVICADGTWNKPEKKESDNPSNILKIARCISPDHQQQVFYDQGVGSYGTFYSKFVGGITGQGIQKNITDCYRYLVQSYSPGDKIYLFGFSRGAYTIRALCGLINNCGILKRENAEKINQAFSIYKNCGDDFSPNGIKAKEFYKTNSHPLKKLHL
ncbi:DUF2235 domain-containing protein [Flammeovirga sp. SubArs3]|uniref:phospholipase effector Tle1 domain-containing protein n=1 Tax=Flammeovirga sp. SubArs3 TaxID=2995316 RepID=UPI00248BEB8F|nr:DUF2235 domain-containing protein [Flammeovirga sp. SubArs3]